MAWASGGAAAAMAVALVAATLLGTASASPAEGIQPLSKIAVHKATVEMQPSAYVRATPSLLGEQVHIYIYIYPYPQCTPRRQAAALGLALALYCHTLHMLFPFVI
jgi:hypothetical protein